MPDPLDRAALDDLLAMAGGDASLLVELLDSFIADADQYATELDAAIAAGDDAALVRPAHSLKSNAMNVGATRLAELSRALELDARGGPVAEAESRVAAVQAELAEVRTAVAEARQEAAGGA
ncbi:MAG TPA: Hpt domain-containing protein [Candidatus Limnocylindria bacterium]|jgi:HPt (histidine-containing phosphotransfer) domain-containing protein